MRTTDSRVMYSAARGFSLLELTLVLVIIGLLMGVAVVSLSGGAERARENTTKATMNTLKTQLNVYFAEKARLPESLDVLVTDRYIEPNSLNDAWKRPFYYQPHTDGSGTYDLVSAGKDGLFETPEDNIDVAQLEVE